MTSRTRAVPGAHSRTLASAPPSAYSLNPLAIPGLVRSAFVVGVGAPVRVGALCPPALLCLAIYTVGVDALGGVVGASPADES